MVLPSVQRFAQRRGSRNILFDFYESLELAFRLNSRGLYFPAQRFTVDGASLDSFARRLIKGLFYHEKGHRLPDDHLVNTIHHLRPLLLGMEEIEFLNWIVGELLEAPPKTFGSTFCYRWLQSPNGASMSWWLIELYGTKRYVCSTAPRAS